MIKKYVSISKHNCDNCVKKFLDCSKDDCFDAKAGTYFIWVEETEHELPLDPKEYELD